MFSRDPPEQLPLVYKVEGAAAVAEVQHRRSNAVEMQQAQLSPGREDSMETKGVAVEAEKKKVLLLGESCWEKITASIEI